MANRSEPNAQNSELDPKKHPSGARIEKIMRDSAASSADKGQYGEMLRPSEREDSAADLAEPGLNTPAGQASGPDSHRRSPSNRQQ